uniref:Uncharacterized protein n=1 Tax=Arundo donax TaxID=35708 RepID=A0A0A9GZL9_ARUDO
MVWCCGTCFEQEASCVHMQRRLSPALMYCITLGWCRGLLLPV